MYLCRIRMSKRPVRQGYMCEDQSKLTRINNMREEVSLDKNVFHSDLMRHSIYWGSWIWRRLKLYFASWWCAKMLCQLVSQLLQRGRCFLLFSSFYNDLVPFVSQRRSSFLYCYFGLFFCLSCDADLTIIEYYIILWDFQSIILLLLLSSHPFAMSTLF